MAMSWEAGESSQKAGVRKESVVWVEKLSEDPRSDGAGVLGCSFLEYLEYWVVG